MSRRVLMFALACALALITSATLKAGEYFDVHGVAANDVLNMRRLEAEARSAANAPIVLSIPHNATNIEATGLMLTLGTSVWRQVKFDNAMGWVNARYLNRGRDRFALSESDRLNCAGTEPFWGLEISGRYAWLSDPETGAQSRRRLKVTERLRGVGRPGLWSISAISGDGNTTLSVVLNHSNMCSDGMSDYTYSMEVFVTGVFAGRGPAQGCCTFR